MRIPKSCREKALELLALRSHFHRELERKLTQRGYDEVEIEETMERLAAEGLLDDTRTAEEFVASRLRRGPIGPMKLMADLKRRGVDHAVAQQVLDDALPDGDLDLAREAAERKLARAPEPEDREARHKLLASVARHLEGKGFSGGSIGRVISEARDRF